MMMTMTAQAMVTLTIREMPGEVSSLPIRCVFDGVAVAPDDDVWEAIAPPALPIARPDALMATCC